jgi:hypothetical protein
MWNRQEFEDQMKSENIAIHIWGRHGKTVADELENKLNFKFNPETRSFIEEIGNLGFEGYRIIITGDEQGKQNCITASEDVGLLQDNQPAVGVKIMDFAGLSYVLYPDDSIKAYEHTYIEPDGVVFQYDSFNALIEAIIKELHENP